MFLEGIRDLLRIILRVIKETQRRCDKEQEVRTRLL